MTRLQKYQILSFNLETAAQDARSLYRSLKGDKGYLSPFQRSQYLESFEYYLSIRNEFDDLAKRFYLNEIRYQDQSVD